MVLYRVGNYVDCDIEGGMTWGALRLALSDQPKRKLHTVMGKLGMDNTSPPETAAERADLVTTYLLQRAGLLA